MGPVSSCSTHLQQVDLYFIVFLAFKHIWTTEESQFHFGCVIVCKAPFEHLVWNCRFSGIIMPFIYTTPAPWSLWNRKFLNPGHSPHLHEAGFQGNCNIFVAIQPPVYKSLVITVYSALLETKFQLNSNYWLLLLTSVPSWKRFTS